MFCDKIRRISELIVRHIIVIHSHRHTCRKRPNGLKACRLCRPSGESPSTRPVQLDPATDINSEHVDILPEIEDPYGETNASDEFFSAPDKRMIVWELNRPQTRPIRLESESRSMQPRHAMPESDFESIDPLVSIGESQTAESRRSFSVPRMILCYY